MSRRDPYAEAAAKRAKSNERLVVIVPASLLESFDQQAANCGFTSRADAIRALLEEVDCGGISLLTDVRKPS